MAEEILEKFLNRRIELEISDGNGEEILTSRVMISERENKYFVGESQVQIYPDSIIGSRPGPRGERLVIDLGRSSEDSCLFPYAQAAGPVMRLGAVLPEGGKLWR